MNENDDGKFPVNKVFTSQEDIMALFVHGAPKIQKAQK